VALILRFSLCGGPSLLGDEKAHNCDLGEILLNRKVEEDRVLVFDHDLAFI
jgi:hypothetical protein